MTNKNSRYWKAIVIVLVIFMLVAAFFWQSLQETDSLDELAIGNGRLEATEVNITTKIGGRLASVSVKEGDMVEVDQVLAKIDAKELEAQMRRAVAEVNRAKQQKNYAEAILAQRKSELSLAKKDLERSKGLYENDNISLEQLQRDETAVQTAQASLAASEAQLSNAEAVIEAAMASVELFRVQLEDSVLKSPINGRVLYRLLEPGEVVAAGGKVLTVLDPVEVYMTIFLSSQYAAKVAVGADAHIVLDGLPDSHVPAVVSFVAPTAQFTPKEVETRTEREKLMFRIKLKLDSEILKKNVELTKTGVTGVAYIYLGNEKNNQGRKS